MSKIRLIRKKFDQHSVEYLNEKRLQTECSYDASIKMVFVKGCLRDANNKIDSYNGQERQVSTNAFVTISRKNVTCFNCGQKEHYKNECLQNSTDNFKCKKCKHVSANVAVHSS